MTQREKSIKGLLEIADWHYGKYEQTNEEDYLNDGDFLTAVANMLKAQEPVVRCRDCKHYDRRCFTCENDVLLIKIDDCGCHPPFRVDDDWFCAYGERGGLE